MTENNHKTPAQILAELVTEAQQARLMNHLANALGINRQTPYLWKDADILTDRNAANRLWEISRIRLSDEASISPQKKQKFELLIQRARDVIATLEMERF